jgi:plastocyanin
MNRLLFAVVALTLPMAAGAAEHTIVIDGFRYAPQALRVKSGDTVVWVNRDIVEHTATASNGAFDSKTVRPQRQWQWVATQRGQYAYICAFHPNMKGVVEVD